MILMKVQEENVRIMEKLSIYFENTFTLKNKTLVAGQSLLIVMIIRSSA